VGANIPSAECVKIIDVPCLSVESIFPEFIVHVLNTCTTNSAIHQAIHQGPHPVFLTTAALTVLRCQNDFWLYGTVALFIFVGRMLFLVQTLDDADPLFALVITCTTNSAIHQAIHLGPHPVFRTTAAFDGSQMSNDFWLYGTVALFIFVGRMLFLVQTLDNADPFFALVMTPDFCLNRVEVADLCPAIGNL